MPSKQKYWESEAVQFEMVLAVLVPEQTPGGIRPSTTIQSVHW